MAKQSRQTAFRLTDARLAALDRIAASLPKSVHGMPATRTDALNHLIDRGEQTMTSETIRWTHKDMISAAVEWWETEAISEKDCRVVRSLDGHGEPCLTVVHRPTVRTSDEAGDAGRWHLDGTPYTA